MAIFHTLTGERTPETGYRGPQVILYSVQCCYAVHWTDNENNGLFCLSPSAVCYTGTV